MPARFACSSVVEQRRYAKAEGVGRRFESCQANDTRRVGPQEYGKCPAPFAVVSTRSSHKSLLSKGRRLLCLCYTMGSYEITEQLASIHAKKFAGCSVFALQ